MIAAFSTPQNRSRTFGLLASGGLLAIAAAAVGVDDNLPGVLLAFLAAIAFVLAFVHPWRTAQKFLLLLLASVLGFVLYIIVNIVLDTAVQNSATAGALRDLLESPVVETLSVIIAILCPAAFVVGAAGSAAVFVRNRRRPA